MEKPKPLFLETIKIHEGSIRHLPYHQERVDRTVKVHFPNITPPRLSRSLKQVPIAGTYKCRILYSETIQTITFEAYTPKEIRTCTLVETDIEYAYKYADRSALEILKKRYVTDEIIMVKEGFITDTTYSNLAFHDGTKWITPRQPLLPGTMRAKLLKEKKIFEMEITPKDLGSFRDMALLNAMIEFKVLKNIRIYDDEKKVLFQKEGYDPRNNYGGLLT